MVRIDDLVRSAERQPVGRDEDRHAARLEHPRDFGEDPLGSGTCSSDWTDSTEAKLPAGTAGPHVGDDRLAVLAVQRAGVEVDADRLARREQVVAVADAAAEVEHPPGPSSGSASA